MFNIEKYAVSEMYKERTRRIFAGLPSKKRPFRVSNQVLSDVWVCREDEKWYLIGTEAAENDDVPNVQPADLHLAVYADGEEFIIVNTRSYNGKIHSWYESMEEILKQARTNWMICRTSQDSRHQAILAQEQTNPVHFKSTLNDCIESAFSGRMYAGDDNAAE